MRLAKVSVAVALSVIFLFGCYSTVNVGGKDTKPSRIYWMPEAQPAAKAGEPAPKPYVATEAAPGTICAPTAAPAPPPAAAAPAPVVAKKLEVIPFYFGFDKYNLENQQLAIDKATAALKADSSKTAELQGNCDRIGTVAYNLKLGDRRANTVKAILVKNGIDAKRLSTKSFGKSKAVGKTDEERKLDRRVDIVLK